MDSSSGLGRPGPGQPEFDRPADASWSASVPPARFGSPPPESPPPTTAPWPAPDGSGAPSGPSGPGWNPATAPAPSGPWGPPSLTPSGPGGPAPRRGGVRAMLIGGTLVVAVALGLLAWQLLPATPAPAPSPSAAVVTPAPAPTSVAPSVVRTPDRAEPTTSAAVTGGSIGQRIDFRTDGGTARVTVTRAAWVDNGVLAPDEGLSYLVVDVSFEGVSGAVTTGPFFAAVREPSGARHLMAVGANLESQLAMRTLRAGQDNTGQVAFEVARGPVTFEVLDEVLAPVAEVEIPG